MIQISIYNLWKLYKKKTAFFFFSNKDSLAYDRHRTGKYNKQPHVGATSSLEYQPLLRYVEFTLFWLTVFSSCFPWVSWINSKNHFFISWKIMACHLQRWGWYSISSLVFTAIKTLDTQKRIKVSPIEATERGKWTSSNAQNAESHNFISTKDEKVTKKKKVSVVTMKLDVSIIQR